MTDAPPQLDLSTPGGIVDYARSLDCIHCGLCLDTCPTYRSSGSEASSPRGRIHLMRAVAEDRLTADAEFREEMDYCLVCRHCESVCPAGVQFGAMMEHTRDQLNRADGRDLGPRLARWLGFRKVLPSRGWLRVSVTLLGVAQRLGLVRLWALVVGPRSLGDLPRVPARAQRRPLPTLVLPDGERREAVQMLAGCVMPELFGRVNRDTARVLAATGAEVRVPEDHVCCGALHAHNGDLDGARELARGTVAAFEEGHGPVVVNSAGCGAHMKEYGRLLEDDPAWRERARAFAERVVDFSEHCAEPARLARLAPRLGTPAGVGRVAWDDPCHLCHGQQLREPPRTLLAAVPGLHESPLAEPESCCGSAGIYSLLRPEDSAEVLDRKLDDLVGSGAQTLVTANPGCHLQWETGVRRRGLRVEVLHLAEVLARALDAGG